MMLQSFLDHRGSHHYVWYLSTRKAGNIGPCDSNGLFPSRDNYGNLYSKYFWIHFPFSLCYSSLWTEVGQKVRKVS